MKLEGYTTNQFTVEQKTDNTCKGCWFKENKQTIDCCDPDKGSEFANAVFKKGYPPLKGSCMNLIATIKPESDEQRI